MSGRIGLLASTMVLVHCGGATNPAAATGPDLGSPPLAGADLGTVSLGADLSGSPWDTGVAAVDMAQAAGDLDCAPVAVNGHWSSVGLPSGHVTPSKVGNAVWGSSSTDVYITGGGCEVIHWDGSQWTTLIGDNLFDDCWAVWGSASSNVFVAGSEVIKWDGSQWENLASSIGGGIFQQVRINHIDGTSSTDLWMVGENVPIHWDGSTWSSYDGGTQILNGVWMASSDDVWAVGYAGTTLHWDGTGWSSVPSGVTKILRAVWGSSSNDVWAVGDGGSVVHWNGSAWASVASNSSNDLMGLWGRAADDVWAVGAAGTAVHFDGCRWSSVATGTSSDFNAVWGSSSMDIWAVGDNGAVFHYGP